MENRRRSVFELIEQRRWIDRCIPAVGDRIRDALEAHGTSLTHIFGIAEIGAATIVAAGCDVHPFPSRGHFAAFNRTAPLDARARSGPRRTGGNGTRVRVIGSSHAPAHHQPDPPAPPSTPGRADLAREGS